MTTRKKLRADVERYLLHPERWSKEDLFLLSFDAEADPDPEVQQLGRAIRAAVTTDQEKKP